ncbi:hypothetical protein RhiirA1_410361 [Rhizophagus irregularis]|uniref:Uncharacterized protein n=1 Tax=Rhizophagus irregularis TaxID=588596 RepID=A0A2N0SDD8_9GLOM|nr:hypothetical protein RhiirA1_410361 [Rhizophagus irregularis]GET51467.1 hypothetical protein RIR_e16178_A0A2N0SDD8_9GLOM [Rhizophagus irregularis DAOM 181602=DAOM 197198]
MIGKYGFSIDFTFNNNIIEGNTPICDYITGLSINDIRSLKNKNIIYMDQLTSPDGCYLLS